MKNWFYLVLTFLIAGAAVRVPWAGGDKPVLPWGGDSGHNRPDGLHLRLCQGTQTADLPFGQQSINGTTKGMVWPHCQVLRGSGPFLTESRCDFSKRLVSDANKCD